MKPTFTNREQYLQWRSEWRARYAIISRDIHDLKLAIRASASGMGRDRWKSQREKILATIKRFSGPGTNIHHAIWKLKNEARQMLTWREESFVLAQEQYLKAKQAVASS